MIADNKVAALIGAVLTGLAALGIVGAPAASAQHLPLPANITCPSEDGVHFLPDPENSNAFYTCKNGSQLNHDECPSVTRLVLGVRPECLSNPDDNLP